MPERSQTVWRYHLMACSRGLVYSTRSDDLMGAIALTEFTNERGYCAALGDLATEEPIALATIESDCYDNGSCFLAQQEPRHASLKESRLWWRDLLNRT